MNTCVTQQPETTTARRLEAVEVRPATDIYELESAYLIVADVPGVDQHGLEISVEDRQLTLEGLAEGPEPEQATLLHREFGPVRYRRVFELSDDIETDRISAVVRNGVVRVTLPKVAQRVPRKIAVQAG